MTLLTTALNGVGLLLLVHAVYSSYEHSLLEGLAATTAPQLHTANTSIPLPIDITVELLLSVALLCVGIVAGASDLKPIKWSTWAGQIESSKEARKLTALGEGGGNPYAPLEHRPGFLNVRKAKTIER